jgi:hypothetical protein
MEISKWTNCKVSIFMRHVTVLIAKHIELSSEVVHVLSNLSYYDFEVQEI